MVYEEKMFFKAIKKVLHNLYPYAFGVFPVITLYLHNYYQVEFFRVARALLVSLLLTGLIELVFWLIFRKPGIVRVLTSYTVLVLFNYGNVYSFLVSHTLAGVNLGRARFLLTFFSLIFALLVWLLTKKHRAAANSDSFASWIAAVLVALAVFNFITVKVGAATDADGVTPVTSGQALQAAATRPNIYHIVLDGYTSSAALAADFGYDNSQIKAGLESLGFVVPQNAFSNYDETISSLSTTLNMDWVENLVTAGKEDHEQKKLVNSLVNSRVRSLLEEQGYQTFAFENEFRWSLWRNADFYESPRHRTLFSKSLNSFEVMYLEGTVLRLAENYDPHFFNGSMEDLASVNLDKYEEQSFALERLPDLPSYISPRFVFAHLTVTHVPYVFDLNGSLMPLENQGTAVGTDFADPVMRDAYITSIRYMNSRLLPIVREIIREDPNAVIVIQGDHGYPGVDRHQIFLAVYDPKQGITGEGCVTPINLYRSIFNEWFGADYPLLENELYKTTDEDLHQFEALGTCEMLVTN
jgi:hypothetical protein